MAPHFDDDEFVQEDEEADDDFEGGIELACREHQTGSRHRPAPSVYEDVRSTLIGDRPHSALSGSSLLMSRDRPSSGRLRPSGRPGSATSRPGSGRPGTAGSCRPSVDRPQLNGTAEGWDRTLTPEKTQLPRHKAEQSPRAFAKSFAGYYLKQHKDKELQKRLEMTAERNQRDRDYQYGALEKLAEMNEWCVALQLPTRYRLLKRDGALVVHVFEDDLFDRELSLEAMLKRHKGMKGRIASLPEKPRGSREEDAARQEALRAALLHTMQVTNKLKEQLALLDRRPHGLSPFVIE